VRLIFEARGELIDVTETPLSPRGISMDPAMGSGVGAAATRHGYTYGA
jgi:hypothetical protein